LGKPVKWIDMTPEEKDDVRERLDKAGIPRLGRKTHTQIPTTYDISTDEYYRMVDKQNGKCLICNTFMGNKLVVDHDHNINKIRGLLCKRCNILVGMIEKFSFLIPEVRKYLKKR